MFLWVGSYGENAVSISISVNWNPGHCFCCPLRLFLCVFFFFFFLRMFGDSEHGLCKGKELTCRTTSEEQGGKHMPENELL